MEIFFSVSIIIGCVLDVFKQEPLDEHSKLWNRKEITITPHIAGLSFGDDVANVFCKNLDIYMMDNDDDENDGKLNYLFDWDKGYQEKLKKTHNIGPEVLSCNKCAQSVKKLRGKKCNKIFS